MKKTLSLLTLFALAACNSTTVIPGSTIKTRTKTIVYTDNDTAADTNLDSRVAVYPITPNLIEKAYRYRIGSGDVLNIMVWAHSDLNSPIQQSNPQTNQVSRGAWVDEGGYITYPLAGKIQAKGKTLDELQNILTNLLRRYIKNPQVAINVTEFRSQRVSVSGAINQAGQLPITNIPMTILDAINQAGGVTQSADTQHIKWTHNGVDRTISLQNMLQYGDMSQNHLLSHGDIVYVPNSSNNKIYIMGEVGKQATLPIGNHGLNLTQALGEVGGMNQAYADATGVFVIRRVPEDAAKPIHIYQLNLRHRLRYLRPGYPLEPRNVTNYQLHQQRQHPRQYV